MLGLSQLLLLRLLLVDLLSLDRLGQSDLEVVPAVHLDVGPAEVFVLRDHLAEAQETLSEVTPEQREVVDVQTVDFGGNRCNYTVLDGLLQNAGVLSETVTARKLVNFEQLRLHLPLIVLLDGGVPSQLFYVFGLGVGLWDFEFDFAKDFNSASLDEVNTPGQVLLS